MVPMTVRRRIGLSALAALLLIAVAEVISAAAIWFVSPRLDEPIRRTSAIYAARSASIQSLYFSNRPRMLSFDAALGWTYAHVPTDTAPEINPAGLRGRRVYTPRPSPGKIRVAAFGDSFVYGNEVTWQDSWPLLVEQADTSLEVLNYGVGGYGVDQAFLRFQREGRALAPQLVLICFVTDDLRRVVNVFRPYIGSGEPPLVKPRFKFDERGALELLPSPMPTVDGFKPLLDDPRLARALGANDQWYEPLMYENPLYDWSATMRLGATAWLRIANRYVRGERMYKGDEFNTESEAFRLQLAIFAAFRDSVAAAGLVPVVVFLPDRSSVTARSAGKRTLYAPLADSLTVRGISYIDAMDAFAERIGDTPIESWFMPGGHYSRAGNLIVAHWLAARIPSLVKR